MKKNLKTALGAALAILIIAGIVIGNVWTYQSRQETKKQNKSSKSASSELKMSTQQQCREIIENHSSHEDEQVLEAMRLYCQYSATFPDEDWQHYYDIYYDITKRRLDEALKAFSPDSDETKINKYTVDSEALCSPDYHAFYNNDTIILSCFMASATQLSQLTQMKALYDLCGGQYCRASAGYIQCLARAMQGFFAYTETGCESLTAMAQTPQDYQTLMDFLNWHLAMTYDAGEYSTNLQLYLQLKMDKLENSQDIPALITLPNLPTLALPDGVFLSNITDVLLRDVNNDGYFELLFGFYADQLPEEPDSDEMTYGYGVMIFSQNQQTGAYEPIALANNSTVYYTLHNDITCTEYDSFCNMSELMALEALGL